jgi:hypothetical protein
MIQALSIAGVVVLFTILWILDLRDFRRVHARASVVVLNGFRWAIGAGVFLSGLWVLPRSSPAQWLLVALFAALAFLPHGWLVRIGGVEPKWRLRALQDDASRLTRRLLPGRPAELRHALGGLIEQIRAIDAPELREMRDLLVADFTDTMMGGVHFADTGLRAIRIYQIEAQVFGADARPPEFQSDEATFRWRLFRTVGDMIDCGAVRKPDHMTRLRQLIEQLNQFRRPDLEVFIDELSASAAEWIESGSSPDWPRGGSIGALGPSIDQSYQQFWPRKSVFWGAELDERDLRALPSVMLPVTGNEAESR